MSTLEELQLNKGLYKITQSQFDEPVSSYEIGAERFTTGDIDGDLSFVGGFIQSKNFVTGSSGWRLDAEGNLECGFLNIHTGGDIRLYQDLDEQSEIIFYDADGLQDRFKMFAEKNNGNLIIRSEIDDSALLFLGEDNKRFNAVYTYVWDELFLGMKSTSGSDREFYLFGDSANTFSFIFEDTSFTTTVFEIHNNGIFLQTNPYNIFDRTNKAGLYCHDVSSSAELFAIDEAGNTTQLSPHNPETKEWEFYSKNTKTGRVLKIKMEQLMKKLDEQYGGGFIEEYFDPVEEQLEETKL